MGLSFVVHLEHRPSTFKPLDLEQFKHFFKSVCMSINLEKIKKLAKDEESFAELVNLIKSQTESTALQLPEMRDFFIIEKNRKSTRRLSISDSVEGVLGYTSEEIENMQ